MDPLDPVVDPLDLGVDPLDPVAGDRSLEQLLPSLELATALRTVRLGHLASLHNLAALAALPHVRRVELGAVRGGNAAALGGLGTVTELHVNRFVPSATLDVLAQLPMLRSLTIEHAHTVRVCPLFPRHHSDVLVEPLVRVPGTCCDSGVGRRGRSSQAYDRLEPAHTSSAPTVLRTIVVSEYVF